MKPVPRLRPVAALLPLLFAELVGSRAIAQPKNDFRFSILGDRSGAVNAQAYERVWREVDLLHPDFVINVGDVIQGGNDELAESEWEEVSRLWARYRYPMYFTPGNHDVWNETSRQLYEHVTGRPLSYSFTHQDAHFTVLDNSRSLNLSEQQVKFLEADLKRNQERSPKFVFLHQPYWIVFLKLGSGEFPLHQLASKYGVNYVISGHGHQFVRLARDGVVYLEVGSSGAGIGASAGSDEAFARGLFCHHVWVTVKGSSAYFTVKEIDAPYGKGRMFRAEDWYGAGPHADPARPVAKD